MASVIRRWRARGTPPRIEDRGWQSPAAPRPQHTCTTASSEFLYGHFTGIDLYSYSKKCMVCMFIVHKWNTLFAQYKCFNVLISYYNILPFKMRIPMNFMNITNSSKSPNKCKFPQLTFIVRFKDPFHFKTTRTKKNGGIFYSKSKCDLLISNQKIYKTQNYQ